MIKIIKKGTRQTRICEKCGCEFSFEIEDINVHDDTEYCVYDYVNCPQCNEEVVIVATR